MLEQEDKRSPWWWFLDFLIGYLPFLPVQMFALHDMMSQMETGGGKVFAVVSYMCMVAIFSGELSDLGCRFRKTWYKKSDSENNTKDANSKTEKASPEVAKEDRIGLVSSGEYDLFAKYGLGCQREDASVS